MNNKKESLLFIESCFRNIQHEKEISKNLKLIQNTVKREYGISLDITILDNKKSFFGMCIYPSTGEIEMLTKAMMSAPNSKVKYNDLEKLHREFMMKATMVVEIDSMLLYDSNLNASAGEVTAILLHEIGHIVASNSVINRMRRAKEYMMTKFDSNVRRLIGQMPMIDNLFGLVSLQIFSNQLNIQLLKEKQADELALKEGYGEDLFSILGKLIANGKGDHIKRSNKEIDKDIEVTIDWLVVNIKELQYRKNRLKQSLKLLKLTTPSKYLSNAISHIHDRLFKHDEDRVVATLVNEAFILSNIRNKKFKAPSGAMDSSGRVKRLVSRDLDIYRAELERVNTVDDKIFLLERLHDLLDIAEYAKYMLETEPRRVMQSEQTIDQYIASLNDLIRATSSKNISKEKYGLYIKYPADYEG